MFLARPVLTSAIVLIGFSSALAEEAHFIGGDEYMSGQNVELAVPSSRDAFVSGFNATLAARVEKDAHVAGFNSNVSAQVGGDLYAAGFNVNVMQPVGEDLNAAGFNIDLYPGSSIGGNARLTGNALEVDGPVQGSLVALGNSVKLNGAIMGDADLTVGTLEFGPNAKLAGKLVYRAQSPISIPPQVISPERVQFEPLSTAAEVNAARNAASKGWPGWMIPLDALVFAMLASGGFILLIGALLFAFAPMLVEHVRFRITRSVLRSLCLGAVAMSACMGFIPVAAMTVLGLPLIPFAMAASAALWVVGYILGIFAITSKVMGWRPSEPKSLLAMCIMLLGGMVVSALLNFVPVIGWLVNFAVMLIGLGGLTEEILARLAVAKQVEALDQLAASATGD